MALTITEQLTLVASGGALGAVFRLLVGTAITRFWAGPFPAATFSINVVGSFVLGLLIGAGLGTHSSSRAGLFLATGVLGAFTTFSTFELEIFELVQLRRTTLSILYLVGSTLCGLIAVAGGIALGRAVLPPTT